MEIFGVPVYLNTLSVACLLPVLLGLLGGGFALSIRGKILNSWQFAFLLISLGVFLFAYAFATSVFDMTGVYHRLLTLFLILITLSFFFYFSMTYSEDTHGLLARKIFWIKFILGFILGTVFIIRAQYAPVIFRSSGQYWDYEIPVESLFLGALILSYAIITLSLSISKYFRMQNRRNAGTFLIMMFAFNGYLFPAAILNPLSRKGVISLDFFIWVQAIGASLSFFIVFVIFLSHTRERTTIIGNLLAIILVSMLVFVSILAYPLIEDRKGSFREIWAAKLQVAEPSLGDKSVVLIQDKYYRDSASYYAKALNTIPSDGVILRADAAGGVYTFPVSIGGTQRIVGIELVELRKYIHPTAAKLVIAQFVVILMIVSLFPLFFRGILLTPMRRLLDGVIAISRSKYGHRIENARSDELGVISRHFDKMAITIEASTVKLEDTVAQRTAQLTEEKRKSDSLLKKSDSLLLNILPERIANELKETGQTQPVRIDSATVIFTDFVGFTKISEALTPEDVVAELDKCFSYFDQVTEKYGLEKLKTIGDSFMCAGGVPEANRTHAIDACLAALEIQAFMNQMKDIKHQQGFPYWELRLGINTGPLVAGVVGHKKFAYDVWGDTVNTASRMESSGVPGEINISKSTYDQVQLWFMCEHRGLISAKSKGEIDMYLLKRIRPEFAVDPEGRIPNKDMKKTYVSLRMGDKVETHDAKIRS
jgi:class 3 adenylate cyclase